MGQKNVGLIILGAGGFAREVADLASDLSGLEVVGFAVSDQPYSKGTSLLGRPVYWVDDLAFMGHSVKIVSGIGSTRRFAFIERVEEMGLLFTSLIHPTARVSRSATIGIGSIISSGVQVATGTRIGKHVVVNRGALVGHDCELEDYVTVSPGANLAGGVTIGRRSWIGLGSIILNNTSVGYQSVIGAGSLVLRDVPDRVKVMGSPAIILEREVEGL